jgi:hypothetical protein
MRPDQDKHDRAGSYPQEADERRDQVSCKLDWADGYDATPPPGPRAEGKRAAGTELSIDCL